MVAAFISAISRKQNALQCILFLPTNTPDLNPHNFFNYYVNEARTKVGFMISAWRNPAHWTTQTKSHQKHL